jgi:hypothetical protein
MVRIFSDLYHDMCQEMDLLAIFIRSSRAISIAKTHRAVAKGADGVLADLASGKRHG